ncbi:PRXL2B [Mytilus coruscus]|uniref:PRXL2B n=1 Tax=Mytilus coruscus TaxID=42192 RepID=A0A6J7ZZX5_MYTCO|nr:PRXL2B [Mytilus coruscus]
MEAVKQVTVIILWCGGTIAYSSARLVFSILQNISKRALQVPLSMELSKIAKNLVKCVTTGENVAIETFYQKQPCIITFMRRLVGVGLEELGLEDFQRGEYFNGDLYIDMKKQCYKSLGFRRMNIFNVFPAIFSKASRNAMSKAKEDKIDGDFKGDGFQNGGTLVIGTGGKVLLNFKQQEPSDHVSPNEVLKVLGIQETVDYPEAQGASCPLPQSNEETKQS